MVEEGDGEVELDEADDKFAGESEELVTFVV
jgi:hypothetical protein